MPKRVIDFDAMWGSDKLAACAAWAQAEYAWLYGLADASGCFELTNLRVIWGRVAAIRGNLTIERLEQVFAEFQDKGLLFVWEHEGKRYAHWTGSDAPGRLPPPSWRMRLEKFAPPVPKQRLAEYMGKFARGRAALAGAGFRAEAQREYPNRKEGCGLEVSGLNEDLVGAGRAGSSQLTERRLLVTEGGNDRGSVISDLREERQSDERLDHPRPSDRRAPASVVRGGMVEEARAVMGGSDFKRGLEETQGQGLDLNWNLNRDWESGRDERRAGTGEAQARGAGANRERDLAQNTFGHSKANANSSSPFSSNSQSNAKSIPQLNLSQDLNPCPETRSPKDLAVARELRVGQGPVCGPLGVRPEALERARRREGERARSGSP